MVKIQNDQNDKHPVIFKFCFVHSIVFSMLFNVDRVKLGDSKK